MVNLRIKRLHTKKTRDRKNVRWLFNRTWRLSFGHYPENYFVLQFVRIEDVWDEE